MRCPPGFEKGDLIVAVPALRVKGRKPDELAAEWSEKVRVPNPSSLLAQVTQLLPTSLLRS